MKPRNRHQLRRLEEIVRLKTEIRSFIRSDHFRSKQHDFLSLASPGDDSLEPIGLLAGKKNA